MRRPALAAALIAALAGCTSTDHTPLVSVDCAGQALAFDKETVTTFEHKDHRLRLRFGDRAPLTLDGGALGRGAPYAASVYGPARYVPIPAPGEGLGTVLYLPPDAYADADVEALAACLRDRAAEIGPALAADPNLPTPRFVGVVRGTYDTFVEVFRKDAGHAYHVDPDGHVTYVETEGGGTTTSMAGLTDVQPDGTIRLDPASAIGPVPTVESLQAYRNDSGESLVERFRITADTSAARLSGPGSAAESAR